MKTSIEQDFIHDLATPLGTAILLAETIKMTLVPSAATEMFEQQMDNLIKALDNVSRIVQTRRDQILPAV